MSSMRAPCVTGDEELRLTNGIIDMYNPNIGFTITSHPTCIQSFHILFIIKLVASFLFLERFKVILIELNN